jgi:hypothetical protein
MKTKNQKCSKVKVLHIFCIPAERLSFAIYPLPPIFAGEHLTYTFCHSIIKGNKLRRHAMNAKSKSSNEVQIYTLLEDHTLAIKSHYHVF